MTRPEVLSGETGPQVFHADFNLVTADRPARAGETLMVWVRGLGPSRPDVLPGQPFPQDPLVVANSPVEVLVGGVAVDALNQVGVPGTIDTYRVDFRVPESAALGTTSLQLRAAWIAGNSVNLTVRYHGVTANGDEMKRRIEITRESSRRIRLQSSGPLRCAGCGSPPELVTVAEAARLIGAPLSTLEAAIEFRRLQVWPADVVCLHCVRKFRKENK